MKKPTVYIDSTIPSLYYDKRPVSEYRREKTRLWWNKYRKNFACYTSFYARQETAKGNYPNKKAVVEMTWSIPLLTFAEEITDIINVYIKNMVMPKDAYGDAAHLAMATYHGLDYLATWNCVHLANAFKYRQLI
jgi:hypothetical protein